MTLAPSCLAQRGLKAFPAAGPELRRLARLLKVVHFLVVDQVLPTPAQPIDGYLSKTSRSPKA